jgi:hypothetical protein
MKGKNWLTRLVKELTDDKQPTVVLAERKNLDKVAIFDEKGQLLIGDLGSRELEKKVSSEVVFLKPGQAASLTVGEENVLCERQGGPKALAFWQEALAAQRRSWAAWLLTISKLDDKAPGVVRHILSANGPFTCPRLPTTTHRWSLLPLNAGLGRMFVFGDDELALEVAALGARTGLKVTLGTVNPLELDIRSAHSIGDFELMHLSEWSDVNSSSLEELGIKPGVMVLITTPDNSTFLEPMRNSQVGWLGLAGEAAVSEKESGLFPEAITPALRAVGLVAAMLERR